MRYNYKTGVIVPFAQRFYKQITIAVAGLFLATFAAATLGASAVPISATEVNVYGSTGVFNQKGAWMFNRDPGFVTPFDFTTAEQSLGNGSIYVQPIGTNASDKFIAEYFAKTNIAEVSSFTYDFKVGAGSNPVTDAGQFYLSVYANFGSSDSK